MIHITTAITASQIAFHNFHSHLTGNIIQDAISTFASISVLFIFCKIILFLIQRKVNKWD